MVLTHHRPSDQSTCYGGLMADSNVLTCDVFDIARFWSKVTVLHPAQCWPWTAATDSDGHGQFKLAGDTVQAHRVAFYMGSGKLPPVVRHDCDNPACCNPGHLLGGEHADNVADRVSRDRSARGEANGRAVLTETAVRSILSDGRPARVIAHQYGVDRSTVSHIKSGKIWRHVSQKTG